MKIRAYLAKVGSAPETQFYHATILDRRWETSLQTTIVDVHRLQADTRYLLNRLFPQLLNSRRLQMCVMKLEAS